VTETTVRAAIRAVRRRQRRRGAKPTSNAVCARGTATDGECPSRTRLAGD
jgi:hypothetical protein